MKFVEPRLYSDPEAAACKMNVRVFRRFLRRSRRRVLVLAVQHVREQLRRLRRKADGRRVIDNSDLSTDGVPNHPTLHYLSDSVSHALKNAPSTSEFLEAIPKTVRRAGSH